MGADAHGGAALRHLSGEVQQTLTACEADAVGVHPGAGQDVLAAGQPGGSDAAGVGKDLFRGAGAEHLPAVHDDHVPAQAVSFVPVVGDKQGRAVKTRQQVAYFAFHLLAEVAVQCAERLIQHQNLRLAHQNTGQRGALLLSAGKLCRAAAGQFFQPQGP